MIRKTVFLFSLVAALLLAGLCSCKQEVVPEKNYDIAEGPEATALNAGVSDVEIPEWEKNSSGLQNLPDAVTSGTGTGITSDLKRGLCNPPEFKKVKNLIVLVCEGLTSDLIEKSTSRYGELIMNSFPVKGTTLSKFKSADGQVLLDYILDDLLKTSSGVVSWGDLACNSLRRISSMKSDEASRMSICDDYIVREKMMLLVMGMGEFDALSPGDAAYLNFVYKPGAKVTDSLADAIKYCNYVPEKKPAGDEDEEEEGGGHDENKASRIYSVFESTKTLPSFRQEIAFSLTWLQRKMDRDGLCLFASYAPSSQIDENGVQDFDEGVAVAVKYVLENPDTALIVCGCPSDGSEAEVCFFGLGKGVSVKDTVYESVYALF